MPILEVEHICKSFEGTEVLKDISFSLEKSQVLSIIGSSGSGKTTLLRCLNFLERPDGGIIKVNGETLFDAAQKSSTQEAEIRKKRLHFGLVFQSFNLFPQYTALENVMLAKELLEKVKSGEADYHFIEIMGCPGGCVNGGGQPQQPGYVRNTTDIRGLRAKVLYDIDTANPIRKSHENPAIKELYATYLGEPGSEKAHHLLHTTYVKRSINQH